MQAYCLDTCILLPVHRQAFSNGQLHQLHNQTTITVSWYINSCYNFSYLTTLSDEDCVHLLNPVDPAGLWNDWKCHYKLGALCERPAKKDCECCEKMKAVLDECCKDDQPDRPTEVEPEPVDQVVDING